MLPVSQYEALLAEVRGLRRKAQRVQQLATPLISSNCCSSGANFISHSSSHHQTADIKFHSLPPYMMESHFPNNKPNAFCDGPSSTSFAGSTFSQDYVLSPSPASSHQHMSISNTDATHDFSNNLHFNGTWPSSIEKTMWNSDPTTSTPINNSMLPLPPPTNNNNNNMHDSLSVMSFTSSMGQLPLDRLLLCSPPNFSSSSRRSSTSSIATTNQLEAKVDMVYSLLNMLSRQEHADVGETLLALCTNPDGCQAMRRSGCIPLLVQVVQSDREAEDTRKKAVMALNNLIQSQPDEKMRKREMRIFKLLEQARNYTKAVRMHREHEFEVIASCSIENNASNNGSDDRHPVQIVAHLMKLSFDELHRQAICQFGGIRTIANLVEAEHVHHGSTSDSSSCILMRRYACMSLTNLTFGDSGNKVLLCSLRDFMRALVIQLQSPSDELRQVTASVLRNLSWRADANSKEILRQVGSVTGLMQAAMLPDNKENTLKSILSALWNLAAHCTENKSEICGCDGALGFLVDMLQPHHSIAIIENSGGILRNISSQIAVRDDYRDILRQHNCLQILLDQLKSSSLTVVSNACGTLWNLSAKCAQDQETLWEMGAPTMLRSLNHSKHKMIAMGSSAALKNLLSARPSQSVQLPLDSTALAMDLPMLPTLGARKQKALLQDLDENLSETYDNIESDLSMKATAIANAINPPSKLAKFKYYKHNDEMMHSSADEKDHCSIEDVSDNDSLLLPTNNVLRDAEPSSSLNVSSPRADLIYGKHLRLTITHDEIDGYSEELKEKCDEEKKSTFSGESSSGELTDFIGIDNKSSISKLNTTGNDREFSNNLLESSPPNELLAPSRRSSLPRRIFTTSTPNRLTTTTTTTTSCNNTGVVVVETSKVQNNAGSVEDLSPICLGMNKSSKQGDNISQTYARTSSTINTIDLLSLRENQDQSSNYEVMSDELLAKDNEVKEEDGELSSPNNCGDSFHVDNRMLDPDAMIESLERFTAELVSQASFNLQSNDDPTTHYNNNNTWDKSSANDVTFPSLSATPPNVVTFESSSAFDFEVNEDEIILLKDDNVEVQAADEKESNDFSSINNTGTLTQSTLITIEARKLAEQFQQNASEMSQSISSVASLEMDPIDVKQSPKMVKRKKSLPKNLMIRRLLSNSLNTASSLESLGDQSLSNLDNINPPSMLGDVFNLESSITSIASLPSDQQQQDVRLPSTDFVINGAVRNNMSSSLSKSMNYQQSLSILSNLENINPPSFFNEVTDMCNSLADVATDIVIGSETEIFEDCHTHVLPTEDEVTEFSDANSVTPIQSDFASSSPESTPKKSNLKCNSSSSGGSSNNKQNSMMLKQKRNLTRDRYKTYSIAAEMVMKDSMSEENHQSTSDDFQTVECFSEYKSVLDSNNDDPVSETTTYCSPTYTVDSGGSSKPSPKERRQMDRSRYETHAVPEPLTNVKQQPHIEQPQKGNATRSKLSIRRNFMQKRLENRQRFQTQTLAESQLPPGVSSPQIQSDQNDEHLLVEQEANLFVKNLKDHRALPNHDDLLECETLSLVSNDDDSEQNSAGSMNYRTYHKSWGMKKNVPVIEASGEHQQAGATATNDNEGLAAAAKPKIVKPGEEQTEVRTEEVKGIRGRRKPLYAKTNPNRIVAKPIRTMSSNLVKNVTASLKTTATRAKTTPATTGRSTKIQVASSGYGSRGNSAKTSPAKRVPAATQASALKPPLKPLEKQGTFTMDEGAAAAPTVKSKIPSKLPSALSKPTGIPSTSKMLPARSTTSAERVAKTSRIAYARSTSADSREANSRKIPASASTQSLKAGVQANGGGVTKKAMVGIPQRSGSNASLNGDGKKQQVTSKIASLWKKIEETKNKQQPTRKDTRVWIGGQPSDIVDVNHVVLREAN